jgi:hypothetical protein
MDSNALDAQIAEAEAALAAAGDATARRRAGRRLDVLNATKLAEVRKRSDHNGHPCPSAPSAAAPPATLVEASAVSFDGGVRPHAPRPTLDSRIAEAEANGDWLAVDRLNALKLAEVAERQRMHDLNPAGAI